ncbi:CBS domain-containing protein [Paenibacillus sp. FSL H8-0548]|uniref:CBS domain-containing protein n=1 Tax=Paenibacillus sp. FSL H8-0548 TaxID=1920422 RepID=UPI00097019F0|nr:CBS domain-containing protein [Paenibacillus sp. FSL H8-0548]OMF18893.1 CBS domain-containing protein [Paenibacillus sp. FSL H8-0548]
MQAHEIMVKEVYKVRETDTVRSVLERFIKYGISGLPVVNERNEMVAYISDGDIMRYIGKHKDIIFVTIMYMNVVKGDQEEFEERIPQILDLNVMSIAKKKVHKVEWNEEVENIAAILGEKRIKKLPVVRKGALVGIISRGDVIRHAFKSFL